MAQFEFEATPDAAEFIERIVNVIIRLFGIPRDEAVGRVNRHWSGQTFRSPEDLMALYHQTTEWWAKSIVFGRKSQWWIDEENARPLPYP